MATRYLGAPYVWAGSEPGRLRLLRPSCAFGQVGVAIPHNAAQQFRLGTPVDRDRFVPGDVFLQSAPPQWHLPGRRALRPLHPPGGVKIARLDDDWFRTRWVAARAALTDPPDERQLDSPAGRGIIPFTGRE
jgi:cell wall-associated NlpC family hydrolase